jgi:serine/threonine protein phosphatase PrpC
MPPRSRPVTPASLTTSSSSGLKVVNSNSLFSFAFDTVLPSASAVAATPLAQPLRVDSSPRRPQSGGGAGGSVWRVEGVLNLSRSLGDGHLKHCISAEPTLTVHALEPTKDQFVILATDGLWGTLTEQQAVDAVQHFVQQEQQAQQQPQQPQQPQHHKHIHSLAARAADHLAALALQRGSMDNVCVIVLFLHGYGQ